jgi:hypothetical protein
MTSTLPASSRSFRGSRPRTAAHQRPSGRSQSTRTDPSTITSPTRTRSRTQISPGIHGATLHPDHHDRSPPELLTRAPVQISASPAGVTVAVAYRHARSSCRCAARCRAGRLAATASSVWGPLCRWNAPPVALQHGRVSHYVRGRRNDRRARGSQGGGGRTPQGVHASGAHLRGAERSQRCAGCRAPGGSASRPTA